MRLSVSGEGAYLSPVTDPAQMTSVDYLLVSAAALAAGAVNAIAGGGTLITFPTLTAIGIPPIAANVTNTVALAPGYLSATFAQSKDLRGQRARLWMCLPAGVAGGILGGLLLLWTEERTFRQLIPFLILLASGLLAVQGPVRAWLNRTRNSEESRRRTDPSGRNEATRGSGTATQQPRGAARLALVLAIGAAAIYGGYFGAGLSVIVLAVLGLFVDDSLTRLNALKQAIAFAVNVAAAVFFVFSGQVVWPAALAMAAGALVGGALGGRLASRIRPVVLRWTIVAIGLIVGALYLAR